MNQAGQQSGMTNEELVEKGEELLKTDADLGFLLALNKRTWRNWYHVSEQGWIRWVVKSDSI